MVVAGSERRAIALPRQVAVAVAAGLVAGVLAAGVGGRLVMRLLAVTSPEGKGSLTEAGEIVGEITLGGTLGFIFFTGLFAGLISGALYALVRPVLPAGHVGGAVLGALLLILVGTTLEPLRSDNFDFNLVGPDWLAVLGFSVIALVQGMLVVALASRWGSAPGGATSRATTVGRICVAVVALVALPGFLVAVADILSSG
jgi:hypothetical protein